MKELRGQSDHWLENQGRLAHPMRYNRATDHYEPVTWDEALRFIGGRLRALPGPNAAAFYTSGRTSNEAAFLYQLYVREFGTNNLPDCSNLCHEATSVGLPRSIGVGKGTVQLADFALTDAVFTFGHNPGSNHPRMLADAARGRAARQAHRRLQPDARAGSGALPVTEKCRRDADRPRHGPGHATISSRASAPITSWSRAS